MKKTLIIILVIAASTQSFGQCTDFFIYRIKPNSLGERPHLDICFKTPEANKDFIKKQFFGWEKEFGSEPYSTANASTEELNQLGKTALTCSKNSLIKLSDTTGLFYIEFILGCNKKVNHQIKIYCAVNGILFLDRIIQELLIHDPKSRLIESFKLEQEIILYDRIYQYGVE